MSRLKYIGHAAAALLVALAAFFSTGIVTADDVSQASIDPYVYVTNVTTDKSSYAVGDTVAGSVDFYNAADVSIGAFSYSLIIGGGFDNAGNPKTVFDRKKEGTLSIGAGEHKIVPFTYVIPANVTGSDVKVQAESDLPSGLEMGVWESPAFAVTGGRQMLTTKDAYIDVMQANGKPYPTHFQTMAGVSIDKAKRPQAKVSVLLLNKTGETVALTPVVHVYDRSIDEGQKLTDQSLPPISVTSANATKPYLVQFTAPTLGYKPGTYEGQIEFRDASGLARAQSIPFRYVITGPMAIIHSAVTDVRSVKSGQAFNVALSVTGTPLDIFFSDATTSDDVIIQASVSDASGNAVSSASRDAVIDADGSTLIIPMAARADADTMKISASITDKASGLVLATYSQQLNAPADQPITPASANDGFTSMNQTLIVFVIALVFLFIIGAAVYFKLSRPVMLLCLALMSGISASIVHAGQGPTTVTGTSFKDKGEAQKHSGGITISVDSPYRGQVMKPGQKFIVRGKVQYRACLNSNYDADIVIKSGSGQANGQGMQGSAHKRGDTGIDYRTGGAPYGSIIFSAPSQASKPGKSYTASVELILKQTLYHSDGKTDYINTSTTYYQNYAVKIPDCSVTNTCPADSSGGNTTTTTGGGGGGGGTNTVTGGGSLCGNANNQAIPDGSGITASTAGACIAGSSAANIVPEENSGLWRWRCADPAGTASSCQAKCQSGTFYCPASNTCSASCTDWCADSVPGNPQGDQADRSAFVVEADGTCTTAPLLQVFTLGSKFSDLKTDECTAFWTVSPSTTGSTTCSLNSQVVSCIDPASGLVPVGKSTFDVSFTIPSADGSGTAYSKQESATVSCARNPTFREQ